MSGFAIRNVRLHQAGCDILRGASFSVLPGRLAVVLGAAHAGKTTLLRAIAGLATPHAGSIRIGEEIVFDAEAGIDRPAERRGVGFVFQSGALWPHWSVAESVAFCASLRASKAETKARVDDALAQVGIADLAARRPAQLSAAERMQVALARALAGQPRLLLLDEPFAGLNADAEAEAQTRLRRLVASNGFAALVATRDRAAALALADRIAFISGGVIEQDGTAEDLYSRPATAGAAAFMGARNRIEGTLVEKAGPRAFLDVMGTRLAGVSRTQAAVGGIAAGLIRTERVLLGGGPGPNRLKMKLSAQTYLGERWELTFINESITVRAYAAAPMRHEFYHLEFPVDALWIY